LESRRFRSIHRFVATVASQPCMLHLPLYFSRRAGRSCRPATQSDHMSASISSASVRFAPRDRRIFVRFEWHLSRSHAKACGSPCWHFCTCRRSPSNWVESNDIAHNVRREAVTLATQKTGGRTAGSRLIRGYPAFSCRVPSESRANAIGIFGRAQRRQCAAGRDRG
jgi:hypothetical protein